jgi:hypothetical protein
MTKWKTYISERPELHGMAFMFRAHIGGLTFMQLINHPNESIWFAISDIALPHWLFANSE